MKRLNRASILCVVILMLCVMVASGTKTSHQYSPNRLLRASAIASMNQHNPGYPSNCAGNGCAILENYSEDYNADATLFLGLSHDGMLYRHRWGGGIVSPGQYISIYSYYSAGAQPAAYQHSADFDSAAGGSIPHIPGEYVSTGIIEAITLSTD